MEPLLVLTLVALGFLPLGILVRRARSRSTAVALVCFVLVVVVLVLGSPTYLGFHNSDFFRNSDFGLRTSQPSDRPIESPRDGFVSSQTCRACHPGHYDSWHSSFHRTMTQPATPATVKANFTNQTVRHEGRVFHLDRVGDEFWVESKPDIPDAPASAATRQRVSLVTGSHHMQIFWTPTGEGRKLEPLPIAYLFEAARWVPKHSVFLMPPDSDLTIGAGRWNDTCIRCHTTRAEPRVSPEKIDSRVAEFGIACEACHGPAEQHVRAHQNPVRRYAGRFAPAADLAIAHPEKMSAARASEVCGYCHSVSTQDRQSADQWLASGTRYRPGDDLHQFQTTVLFTNRAEIDYWLKTAPYFLTNRFWADGMVRVSGREFNGLLDSPCYLHGKDERQLSCLSCHAMHQSAADRRPRAEWASDQLKPGMDGNRACLQCHEKIGANLTAHTHHPATSTGSDCYNCHMPYTTYGLLKAIRSHRVSSPSVQSSLATGRPNACNQCHLDRTLAWSAEHLHQWYGQTKPALSDDEQNIAAAILWTLQGDAGQRALMAWTMGWEPAKQASGADWLAPFLAPLLNDPYDAVRYISQRSLKRLPGFESFPYDHLAPVPDQQAAARQALLHWRNTRSQFVPLLGGASGGSALLLDANGQLRQEIFLRLLSQRNNHPIQLSE
ncbi:MAG: multiheme c-type cytochrome [Verrucomicrobiota bacterium]